MITKISKDIKYIPFIEFHKKQKTKTTLNAGIVDGETYKTFEIEQTTVPYNQKNITIELDKQNETNVYLKAQRITYPIKGTQLPYTEFYENLHDIEDISDIEEYIENIIFSEEQTIASSNSVRKMFRKISFEQFNNNNYLLRYLMKLFEVTDLSYNSYNALYQLPVLWEQYIISKQSSNLSDAVIDSIRDEFSTLMEDINIQSYQDTNMVSNPSGYINLQYYESLFNNLDQFERNFNPMKYNIRYEIPSTVYSHIISNLLTEIIPDVKLKINTLIWQKLLLRGQITTEDDVKDYITFPSQASEEFNTMLYLFYYNKYKILKYLNGLEIENLNPFPQKEDMYDNMYEIFTVLFRPHETGESPIIPLYVQNKFQYDEETSPLTQFYRNIIDMIYNIQYNYETDIIYDKDQEFPVQFFRKPTRIYETNDYRFPFEAINITDENGLITDILSIKESVIEEEKTLLVKGRILISLSNSNIILKLYDDINDPLKTQMKMQSSYILNEAQSLRWQSVPRIRNYSYSSGIENVEKVTNLQSYFIPYNIYQQYTDDIDKDTLKVAQTTNTSTNVIQQIKLSKLKFHINHGSQVYIVEY